MPDHRNAQYFNSDARSIDGLPAGLQGGIDVFTPFIAGAQAWTRQVSEANASLQREWLSFIDRRLKEDAALVHGLADCKAADDVMRLYSSFFQTAFEDYQQEFSTLSRLGTQSMTGVLESMKSSTSAQVLPEQSMNGEQSNRTAAKSRPASPATVSH